MLLALKLAHSLFIMLHTVLIALQQLPFLLFKIEIGHLTLGVIPVIPEALLRLLIRHQCRKHIGGGRCHESILGLVKIALCCQNHHFLVRSGKLWLELLLLAQLHLLPIPGIQIPLMPASFFIIFLNLLVISYFLMVFQLVFVPQIWQIGLPRIQRASFVLA